MNNIIKLIRYFKVVVGVFFFFYIFKRDTNTGRRNEKEKKNACKNWLPGCFNK